MLDLLQSKNQKNSLFLLILMIANQLGMWMGFILFVQTDAYNKKLQCNKSQSCVLMYHFPQNNHFDLAYCIVDFTTQLTTAQ